MGAQGQTTITFGAIPGTDYATATVTGQASILSGSLCEAWIDPTATATADHSVDEHIMAQSMIGISCSAIAAGTGFTINASTQYGKISGIFNIAWVWN